MKIILSGGGTLGPVVPLLAIREAYLAQFPDTKFIWVGTAGGPEKELVEKNNLPFFAIGAGKWRRYLSLLNIFDFFKIAIAFFQSLFFLWHEKPNLIISAGGFVSVPLHWAGAILGVPAWVHQQDVRLGLANRLMFPFAKKITTALNGTAALLPAKKTEWIGNPSRDLSLSPVGANGHVPLPEPACPVGRGDYRGVGASLKVAREKFGIPENVPVIFALGGGTGSASINKIVLDALQHWPTDWHVIHLVGRSRPREIAERAAKVFPNYHVYQFFDKEMAAAYAIADVVVARAGFSTLSELATLGKAAVILPMYGTHQEENARIFAEEGGIMVLEKGTDNGLKLAAIVKELVNSPEERTALGNKLRELLPRAKPEKIVEIINLVKR